MHRHADLSYNGYGDVYGDVLISGNYHYEVDYCEKGKAHLKKSDFDAAIKCFNFAIMEDSNKGDPHYHRGISYYRKYKAEHAANPELINFAIADIIKAIQLSPKPLAVANANLAIFYHARALLKLQGKLQEEALVDLNEAIKHNPCHLNSLLSRAAIYAACNDYQNALTDYLQILSQKKIYQTSKTFMEVCNHLSALCQKHACFCRVIVELSLIIDDKPNNADLYFLRSRILLEYSQSGLDIDAQDLLSRSLLDCDKSIKIDTTHILAILLRGVIFEVSGKPEQAIHEYFKASKMTELGSDNLQMVNEMIIKFFLSFKKLEDLKLISKDDFIEVVSKFPVDYANHFFRKAVDKYTRLGKFARITFLSNVSIFGLKVNYPSDDKNNESIVKMLAWLKEHDSYFVSLYDSSDDEKTQCFNNDDGEHNHGFDL